MAGLAYLRIGMERISRLFEKIATWQMYVCSWGMVVTGVAMTIIILIQIFFRFVIYRPVPWSEEAARYLMIWLGMLGSVVAMRKGRHIGVTALVDILPPSVSRLVAILVRICMACFLALITWEGFNLALFNYPQLSAAMEISMMVPYLAIPVGTSMMIIDLISDLLNELWPCSSTEHGRLITRSPDLKPLSSGESH